MHQVHGRVAGEGKIPIFFLGMLPLVVSSPMSLTRGAGVQFRWAKASPCYGKHDGEVEATSRVPHGAGHGSGGPAVACRRRKGDVVAGSKLGRAREVPVAPVNRVGETRRRQALPVVLAMVESKRLRRRSDRGAVWSNGGPSVAFVYLDRERGMFRGEEEPAKVVASPLPR